MRLAEEGPGYGATRNSKGSSKIEEHEVIPVCRITASFAIRVASLFSSILTGSQRPYWASSFSAEAI